MSSWQSYWVRVTMTATTAVRATDEADAKQTAERLFGGQFPADGWTVEAEVIPDEEVELA